LCWYGAGEWFHSDTVNDIGRLDYFHPSGLAALEGGSERLGRAACRANQPACVAVGNQFLADAVAAGKYHYRTSLTTVPRFKIETQTYSVTGSVDTSFGEVRAIGAYRQLNSTSYDTENDGSPLRLLAVWGRNITNLRDNVNALVIPQLDFGRSIIREPRTYGVTATARF